MSLKEREAEVQSETAAATAEEEEEEEEEMVVRKPVSRFTRWYRSPLFNVIIVGLISFTQPGIWNALNSE